MMKLKLINFLLCLTLINACACAETKNDDGGTETTKESVQYEFQEITPEELSKKKKGAEKDEKPAGVVKNLFRKIVLNEDNAWREGQAQYDKQNYRDALALFTIGIKKDKYQSSPLNHISRAKCYLKLDQRSKAIQDLDEVVRRDHRGSASATSIKHQCLVIRALIDLEELDETIFKEICCLQNNAFIQVAYDMCSEKRFERALRLYAIVLPNSGYREYYLSRATCYYKMGKLEDARSDVEEAKKARSCDWPGNIPLWHEQHNIGLKENSLNILDAWTVSNMSIEEFKEKLELSDEEAAREGIELYETQQYPRALLLFSLAIKKNKSESNFIGRGKCYAKMNMLEKAERDFKEVARRDEYHRSKNEILVLDSILNLEGFNDIFTELNHMFQLSTITGFGHRLCSNKEFERAIRLFNAAISKMPCKEYYFARAVCHAKMGKVDQARSDWITGSEKTETRYAMWAPSNEDLDLDLKNLKKEQKSIVTYLLKTELHNADLEGKVFFDHSDFAQVGEELFDAGKYEDAILMYSAAIAIKPNLEYYRKRGDCHSKLGQENDMNEDYQRASVTQKYATTNI